jgi:Cdc6-like AAA superfamily ATPase
MTRPQSPFAALTPGTITALDETAEYSRSWHQWSEPEIDALTLATRPAGLLVRGEPGTGKTQLARAAARVLDWKLHAETIHPVSSPTNCVTVSTRSSAWPMPRPGRGKGCQSPG